MTAFRSWRPTCWLALGLLGLALMGLGGCVSMDEHKKLENAFNQARQQLAEAENDKANLLKQIESLNAQLADKNSAIKGFDALKAERDALAAELAKLKDEYNKLLEFAGKPALPADINEALRKLAEQYPDLLEYDPKLGMIRFKSDVTFDLGSTEVKPRAREALAALAKILNNELIANNEIRIVGHTDDVPIRKGPNTVMNPNNWYLSTNRAHAVRAVLESDGVNDTRLQAAGWGETRPIAPNAAGHKGNEKNRRVEIYILPSKVPEGAVPSHEGEPTNTSIRRAPAAPRTPARTPVAPVAPAAPTSPATPGEGVPLPR